MSTMKKVTTTLGLALVNLLLFVPVVFAQEGAAAAGQMTDKAYIALAAGLDLDSLRSAERWDKAELLQLLWKGSAGTQELQTRCSHP